MTDRIAVGGGIWTDDKMIEVVRAGVTHIVDMQIEWDDTALAKPYGVKVLWNPTDDDFQPKPPEPLQRGVHFVLEALDDAENRVFIHCAAGVHRCPHDDAGGAVRHDGLPPRRGREHHPGAALKTAFQTIASKILLRLMQ